MKNRIEIINYIIKQKQYKRYLEIGIKKGSTFKKIICDHKDGVDPKPKGIVVEYRMTSDKFFETIPIEQKYDIIFIDGMHEKNQVLRDVENSLQYLTDGGTIVAHDCSPERKRLSLKDRCYNIWEAIVALRQRPDLNIKVINVDRGIGIIVYGSQKILNLPEDFESTYEYLDMNRKKLLNLISPEEFENEFNKE